MKTYFRLLSFSKPIEKFAIPYILTTVLFIIFNTLNLALLAPLLNTLFASEKTAPSLSRNKPEVWNIMGNFNYYVEQFIASYGIWHTLQLVCAIILGSVLLANLFRYLSQRVMENLRAHTLLNLRRAVFNNVMNLHLGYFSNERKGDIISKVASDVQVVQYSVTGTMQVVFKEPIQLLFYMMLLFNISAKLTFFALLVIPVSAFIIARIVKRLKEQAADLQSSFGLMISFLDEALGGIKTIKAFNATERIKNKFDQENLRYTSLLKSMAKRQQLASPVSEFMGVGMVTAIILYGGSLIINGNSELAPATFITYIALFSQVMRPAKAITDSFSNIHQGIAAGERILDLIDKKPLIIDHPKAIKIDTFQHNIEFQNVTFSYHDKPVLNNLKLCIPKGKIIALVGPSGGGKSTLMDLIPRFIEPQSGRILIDGKDINLVTTDSLRALMGIVTQEAILFNDTIFNNIAFGKPDASPQQVEAAARIANAHEFILNTEKGYETNVGDRGIKLSGGQKQRISIARAILANPPIMLLDEATSALDTESEKLVQEALNKLMENRTSLVIAHRLSTIQSADQIIVLENGAVVEQGNHLDLLEKAGLYSRLINLQQFEV
jgi:subfamily B ATP-binding cassette protein MsbA